MIKENIFTKLQNLQKEIGTVSKDATNPFYKSKYFDINSLIKQLKLGSEITYYRRYTLQSLLALQAEDDDGNKAITPADDEKSWLNENTPQYTEAINFLKGGGTIEQIKTKYKISKKTQDVLSRL